MRTKFTYDFTKKAIVGTKASIKRANAGKNPEYAELCEKLAEHPDFVVIEKVIKTKATKKTYNNLTLKKMEDYIETQADAESKLIEFRAVQKVAEARGAKYPLTKKWFLATYPEYKGNCITADQTEALIEAEAEALAKAEASLAKFDLTEEDILDEDFDEAELDVVA